MSYDKERILILIKTIKTMESKVKVWIARDKDGFVGGHKLKPDKMDGEWQDAGLQLLDVENWFNFDTTNIKWEDDEPTEAYITLAEPQEQPKQEKEIDWEQRRYEIAKDIMPVIYQRFADRELKYGQIVKKEYAVDYAIEIVDMLIKKLKDKSE